MPLGLYLSVPFCRTKCTYCNFASDVFSKAVFDRYIDRVCSDIENSAATAAQMGAQFDRRVDSIYLGGGTPTILDISQLRRLFVMISQNFNIQPGAEITVECAPGTLSPTMLEGLQALGVNRVSLGVQSFVDKEAASVGRLHSQKTTLDDIANLRRASITNINVDLIAGLPHQTTESWQFSVQQTIASQVPHVSIYMLEVDEDSRLGRELIAGGTKYHAHFVPDDDLTADLYGIACERLEQSGIRQYEISNFAVAGSESRHNLKYWARQPYLGFGVDAHSMILASGSGAEAVRFSTPDSLEAYISGAAQQPTLIDARAALEESFFLGLRLNRGVNLGEIASQFGEQTLASLAVTIDDLVDSGLLERSNHELRLTPRGRLLSNEVFERFLSLPTVG
jgi:oxygen-independent coproporphyrinogen III oxidase